MSRKIVVPPWYVPRWYQKPVWEHFEPETPGLRGSIVWHRRGGKDLTSVNLCAFKAFQRVGMYWHILPTYKQGRQIVWEGITGDGKTFLSAFPDEVITRKNNVEMQLDLLNGSKYRVVGSDNVDTLVGTNPVGVVFSEYSLQDPAAWNYIRPILAENGGWALFIFTPRGRNHGYKLHRMAQRNSRWFDSILTVNDTHAVSQEVIDNERAEGMEEALIQQEYFCSFEAPLSGSYYATQMANVEREGRILTVPWEPSLPVDTFWDLGVNDTTAIGFVQNYQGVDRFIDFYQTSGEGLPHYAKVLERKPYAYGTHFAPHDIEVKELGTGETRRQIAASLGIKFQVVKKHRVEDGIEQARTAIPKCVFDRTKCEGLTEALKAYRKEYDEKHKCFRNNPLHDWSSNAADMFRYFAWVSKSRERIRSATRKQSAEDDYEYL